MFKNKKEHWCKDCIDKSRCNDCCISCSACILKVEGKFIRIHGCEKKHIKTYGSEIIQHRFIDSKHCNSR